MASPVKSRLSGLDGTYLREQLLEWRANGSLGALDGIINLRKPSHLGFTLKDGKVTIILADPPVVVAPVAPTPVVRSGEPPATGVVIRRTNKETGKVNVLEVWPDKKVGERPPMIYSDAVLATYDLKALKKYVRGTLGFNQSSIHMMRRNQCLQLISWTNKYYMQYWAWREASQ